MNLRHGDNVGPYSIERELGRGGMGIVFLGSDSRLDRPVAIKVMPAELAHDPDRLARFEREAKTLAQLNHPNVAGIYGIEEHEGRRFLVLEFVEGGSLADMLERGPMPVHDAIEIAVQIAAGVEAAHDAGVIHRDLKPGNVIVTPDGVAKVLDFGLARVDESSSSSISMLSDSPTLTSPAQHSPTMPGVILGTAAYMSPEQARGRRVDKRTDIWSFGVVLYEMLVGMSPFVGETVSDSIGAILHKDIDLDRLPPDTPANVRRVLERCLERDKSLRYRDIGDVRIELLRTTQKHEHNVQASASLSVLKLAFAAMCIIAAVATVGWYLTANKGEPRQRTVRKYDLMRGTTESPLNAERARISPDGTRIAFVRDQLVYVRDFSSFEARPMSGTDGANTVFWSPDSKWIGYTTDNAIHKVSLLGGGAIKVADAQSNLDWDLGCGWTSDDRIIYRENDFIAEVAARGGIPTPLLNVNDETEVDFHAPNVVRGTDVVLFVEHRRNNDFGLAAYDGETRVVLSVSDDQPIGSLTYAPTGHVLFIRGFRTGSLWAIGFDPQRMKVTTEPFLVLSEASQPSVADDGTLAVHRGSAAMSGQLVFADLDGAVEPIGDSFEWVQGPVISPDQTKIALSAGKPGKFDIWVLDLERGSRTRITFTEALIFVVAWSPDAAELATVTLNPNGATLPVTEFHAADGSGQTRPSINTGMMTIDADWKVGVASDDLLAQPTLTAIFLDDPANRSTTIELPNDMQSIPVLNPAGTLMAYASRQSGESQVYCTRFPDGTGKWQVSVRGGSQPCWSLDGNTLYFAESETENKIYGVEVATEPSVRFGMPQELLDVEKLGLELDTGWCVTADGQRIVSQQAETESKQHNSISIIENWYEEFRTGD